MKNYYFLWLLMLLYLQPSGSDAQGGDFPYEVKSSKDILGISLGGALNIGGLLVRNNVSGLTPSEIALLDEKQVWAPDRKAVRHYSADAERISDLLLYGATLTPFALLGDKKVRRNGFTIGVMYLEASMISLGLTGLTKGLTRRIRPFAFNTQVPPELKQSPNVRYSFFSGHASSTATFTFFTAKVFSDLHPDSGWRPFVWTAAAVIPAATGLCRYLAGKHYPSDVIVGYGIGALSGILIPQWHKVKRTEGRWSLNLDPAPGSGMAFNFRLQW